MSFARSNSYRYLPSNPNNLKRGTRIRRPSEVSIISAPADQRPTSERPVLGKAMYAGGRLSRQHREKLHRLYCKQEGKSELEAKYEAKFNKKLPHIYSVSGDGRWRRASGASQSLRGSESTPTLMKGMGKKNSSSGLSNKSNGAGSDNIDAAIGPNNAAPVAEDDFADVNMYAASDCSEPPRTKLVEQKLRGSGELDWVSIIQYKQAIADLDEKVEKEQVKERKKALRHDLERQIKSREERRKKEDSLKQIELDQAMAELQRIQAEDDRKANVVAETRRREKEIRTKQNAEIKQARARRAERRKRRDLALMSMVRKQCEQAKQDAIDKKIAERKKQEQMMKDNEVQQQRKREEAQRQAEYELELQRQYIEMVERKERERNQFYQQTAQKQEQNLQALVKNTSEAMEVARQDELRALKEQLEYDRKKENEERMKKDRIQKQKQEIAIESASQIRAREEKHRLQVENDRSFRKHLIAESKRAHERELREAAEKRLKMQEQAMFLEKQMEELEIRKLQEQVAMSETERKLNGDMLRRVQKWEIVPSAASGFRPRPY